MSESKLNDHSKPVLNSHAKMQRVEPALANVNFPDWYITLTSAKVLIEAKYLRKWPSRSQTGIKFKRFTPGQKQFIYTHGRFGKGGIFVLLQVDDDIMLFPWHYVYKLEDTTKKQCFDNCIFKWSRGDRLWRSLQFKEELI